MVWLKKSPDGTWFQTVWPMVQRHGLGRRLGGHWDRSVAATRIGLGRYVQNAT